MIAIAVVIVLGIVYGMYGGNGSRQGTISVEAYQSVRRDGYKLADLREKDKVRKFPVSVTLIYGVLRQGTKRADYVKGDK